MGIEKSNHRLQGNGIVHESTAGVVLDVDSGINITIDTYNREIRYLQPNDDAPLPMVIPIPPLQQRGVAYRIYHPHVVDDYRLVYPIRYFDDDHDENSVLNSLSMLVKSGDGKYHFTLTDRLGEILWHESHTHGTRTPTAPVREEEENVTTTPVDVARGWEETITNVLADMLHEIEDGSDFDENTLRTVAEEVGLTEEVNERLEELKPMIRYSLNLCDDNGVILAADVDAKSEEAARERLDDALSSLSSRMEVMEEWVGDVYFRVYMGNVSAYMAELSDYNEV